MRTWLAGIVFGVITGLSLQADEPVTLTKSGVLCSVGKVGQFTLGLPALDGRNTHAPVLTDSIVTDGKTLTAKYGAPFDGVTIRMKALDNGKVEYVYTALPPDLHLVMCQFNIPKASLAPGLTVTFDQSAPKVISAEPGKTNKDVTLASVNAENLTIQWPTGETLALTSPRCWHGIQDARIWFKNYLGVCLTPPLSRDTPGGDKSTFVLTFAVQLPPTATK